MSRLRKDAHTPLPKFLLSRLGGRDMCIRTHEGGRGNNFQFPQWGDVWMFSGTNIPYENDFQTEEQTSLRKLEHFPPPLPHPSLLLYPPFPAIFILANLAVFNIQ